MLGIYCRISVDRENEKSIKEQQLLGQEFAKKNGFQFKDYIDKGISGGGDPTKRPAFSEMLADIESGKIKALFVWNLDRTAREEATWFNLANLIVEKDITLYEDGKLLDLSDPSTYFTAGIMSQMNALYRRTTSKKIKAVLDRNAKEGKVHGRIHPFGYTKDENGYLVIDEQEAEIVKKVYQMSLNGIGSSTIRNWLVENNIPTRYNKMEGTLTVTDKYTGVKKTIQKKDITWSDKTVQDMLRNPIYKGKRKWGEKFYDCPAIFDASYWQKVNDHLPKNRLNSGKKVDHEYLLKGLLICGKCGRNLYGRKRADKKDNVYICSSRRYKELNCGSRGINIDKFEAFVWNRFFKGDELLTLLQEELKKGGQTKKMDEIKSSIEKLENQNRSLEGERQKAVQLAIKGLLKESDIQPEMERIENQINNIGKRIDNLKEELSDVSAAAERKSQLQTDIKSIKGKTSFNRKKELIDKYIKNIRVFWFDDPRLYLLAVNFNLPMQREQYIVTLDNAGRIDEFINFTGTTLEKTLIEGITYM
ncbi:recombinase family protein [Allomuricauda sp. M10]|uniref:recombinase family protein n=1 Tax=Allomuricauda sp. M10 TaxID=2683292 RepID=UPI001D190D9D|nr:recombinase family protein [Muricauda sp. M10]